MYETKKVVRDFIEVQIPYIIAMKSQHHVWATQLVFADDADNPTKVFTEDLNFRKAWRHRQKGFKLVGAFVCEDLVNPDKTVTLKVHPILNSEDGKYKPLIESEGTRWYMENFPEDTKCLDLVRRSPDEGVGHCVIISPEEAEPEHDTPNNNPAFMREPAARRVNAPMRQ
jgi:hypothetical protein